MTFFIEFVVNINAKKWFCLNRLKLNHKTVCQFISKILHYWIEHACSFRISKWSIAVKYKISEKKRLRYQTVHHVEWWKGFEKNLCQKWSILRQTMGGFSQIHWNWNADFWIIYLWFQNNVYVAWLFHFK